ncbi:MAG TPA: WYL domain-containing protein [Acidimicrobiales bacterium]|nr:WYL domain-containing protein [Acidimicrobiales bacterium]
MPRIPVGDRLPRVLAYIPWIASQDGPTIADVCSRFDVTEKRLLADLAILPFIGLPPYTPDALMEVTVEDGRVWIHYADFFSRPLRLTPEEGLSLIAAGAVLHNLPGHDADGPLERGLVKLAALLGVDPDLVDTGQVDPAVLDLVSVGANEHRSVDVTYYSHGRDERSERRIDPWRVFNDKGEWYVIAYCHKAGGERVFRIDRIESARSTDEHFEPPGAAPPIGVFHANDDDPRVTLDLAPSAAWVLEQYPVEDATANDDGSIRVTMAVAATRWFDRLLLRLGDQATIVEAPEQLQDRRRLAARTVLARYGR